MKIPKQNSLIILLTIITSILLLVNNYYNSKTLDCLHEREIDILGKIHTASFFENTLTEKMFSEFIAQKKYQMTLYK